MASKGSRTSVIPWAAGTAGTCTPHSLPEPRLEGHQLAVAVSALSPRRGILAPLQGCASGPGAHPGHVLSQGPRRRALLTTAAPVLEEPLEPGVATCLRRGAKPLTAV